MAIIPIPQNIGKKGRVVDIAGQPRTFLILDEVVRPETNNPEKVIYLQKIQFQDNQKIVYRLAYYIIGKKPKMAGKWVFGQFATTMAAEDMVYVFQAAKERGWLVTE